MDFLKEILWRWIGLIFSRFYLFVFTQLDSVIHVIQIYSVHANSSCSSYLNISETTDSQCTGESSESYGVLTNAASNASNSNPVVREDDVIDKSNESTNSFVEGETESTTCELGSTTNDVSHVKSEVTCFLEDSSGISNSEESSGATESNVPEASNENIGDTISEPNSISFTEQTREMEVRSASSETETCSSFAHGTEASTALDSEDTSLATRSFDEDISTTAVTSKQLVNSEVESNTDQSSEKFQRDPENINTENIGAMGGTEALDGAAGDLEEMPYTEENTRKVNELYKRITLQNDKDPRDDEATNYEDENNQNGLKTGECDEVSDSLLQRHLLKRVDSCVTDVTIGNLSTCVNCSASDFGDGDLEGVEWAGNDSVEDMENREQ